MVLTQCSRNLGLIIGQGSLQRRAWREETCGWVISEYQTCIWYVYAIASKTVQVSRTMLAYVVIRTVSCIETSSGIILCLLWSSTRTKGISDISGHWNGIGMALDCWTHGFRTDQIWGPGIFLLINLALSHGPRVTWRRATAATWLPLVFCLVIRGSRHHCHVISHETWGNHSVSMRSGNIQHSFSGYNMI